MSWKEGLGCVWSQLRDDDDDQQLCELCDDDQQLCDLCVINGLPNEFPLNTALCEVEIDRAEETVRLQTLWGVGVSGDLTI